MKKTLYVNGKFLTQATTGVQRYAAGIVDAWDREMESGRLDPSAYSIRLIVPKTKREIPRYKRIEVVASKFRGRLWEQIELPLRSAGQMLFSPYAAAPLIKFKHIVTIHDAGIIASSEQYSKRFRRYYQIVYRCLGLSCRKIITVSKFSKHELHKYFSISLDKMVVISPGCDHLLRFIPDLSILDRFDLIAGKFVLGVSSLSPIKNFGGLIRAWGLVDRADLKLAIAGKTNNDVFHEGADVTGTGVVSLGYVSDEELRALYENASAFVYPSFYEGFGLPPLEAMGCGCPVIVARSSALPEACGNAAIYCDPSDPEDIAEKICSLLDDPVLTKNLSILGLRRSSQFTTQETASLLWAEIQNYL